jgi:hypothetical protein
VRVCGPIGPRTTHSSLPAWNRDQSTARTVASVRVPDRSVCEDTIPCPVDGCKRVAELCGQRMPDQCYRCHVHGKVADAMAVEDGS